MLRRGEGDCCYHEPVIYIQRFFLVKRTHYNKISKKDKVVYYKISECLNSLIQTVYDVNGH